MLHNALHTYESTSSTDNALLARTGRKHKHQNKQPEAKRRKNKLDASIPVVCTLYTHARVVVRWSVKYETQPEGYIFFCG